MHTLQQYPEAQASSPFSRAVEKFYDVLYDNIPGIMTAFILCMMGLFWALEKAFDFSVGLYQVVRFLLFPPDAIIRGFKKIHLDERRARESVIVGLIGLACITAMIVGYRTGTVRGALIGLLLAPIIYVVALLWSWRLGIKMRGETLV